MSLVCGGQGELVNFPVDDIACEQARALAGLEHRYPEDNYCAYELNRVDLLLCADALARENVYFVLPKWSGELHPLHTVRMPLDDIIRRR
jgi:hypothetical protein